MASILFLLSSASLIFVRTSATFPCISVSSDCSLVIIFRWSRSFSLVCFSCSLEVEFSTRVHYVFWYAATGAQRREWFDLQRSPATVYTHCMTSSRACPNERGLPPSWSRWRWCERWETESKRRLNSSSTVLSLSRCTISPRRKGEGGGEERERRKGRKTGGGSKSDSLSLTPISPSHLL